METIEPVLKIHSEYRQAGILERMVEPDRRILFKVPWVDDNGNARVNRGMRVQFNNSIGPYKGGLRFHPSVNLSIIKFLGFEQIFKNALTGRPIGGGKGGSDFDPKGKTDGEIMRFCQSFMNELYRHIGANIDVPAGDIGVGGREIGYLFGQYKRLTKSWEGVITGKSYGWGGSLIRPEATGYGQVYFLKEMMEGNGDSIEGKICTVSGSGNVAQYCTEKLIQMGGKVVTLSDSSGFVYDPAGIDEEKLAWIMDLKNNQRGRIKEYAENFDGVTYEKGERPWGIKCDIALPSATQNEIEKKDAEMLVKNGCKAVVEGANMPSTPEAVEIFEKGGIMFGPAKAVNAGGVGVSGLEMSQNSARIAWDEDQLRKLLENMMRDIHDSCVQYGESKSGPVNYLAGANIAGFVKVADAMLSYGHV